MTFIPYIIKQDSNDVTESSMLKSVCN